MYTLCKHSERLDDESEMDKGDEHEVEFFKSREDATKPFESAKEPLELILAWGDDGKALRVAGRPVGAD